jgi:hypothetical protein
MDRIQIALWVVLLQGDLHLNPGMITRAIAIAIVKDVLGEVAGSGPDRW